MKPDSISQIESQIIAAALQFPSCRNVVLQNCGVDFFSTQTCEQVLEWMREISKDNTPWGRSDFILEFSGVLKKEFIHQVTDNISELSNSFAKSYAVDKIRKIKELRSKKFILRQINQEAKKITPDFTYIEELARKGQIQGMHREDGSFQAAWDEYRKWVNTDPAKMISIGLPCFDKATGHYSFGETLGIMARTTVGKTFIGLNILNWMVMKLGNTVGFFSLEMAKGPIVERMMQLHYDLGWSDIRRKLNDGSLALDAFRKKYMEGFFLYEKNYGWDEIEEIIERDNLQVIFIDFLQLMKMTDGKTQYEKMTNLVKRNKTIAKTKNVFIITLIQISRKGEGGWVPVTIEMARESGAIEEYTDFLIGAWDNSLNPDEDKAAQWEGTLVMKMIKNKRGPQVKRLFHFDKMSRKLREVTEDGQ
jgi:replicative DNA helicase